MASPLRRTKLAQSLSLDLADALARYVKFLTDFFKRVLALAADAEAQPDHLLLFGRKRLENVRRFIAHVGVDHRIDRRSHPAVLDQITQRGLTVAADWGFQRHRIARNRL